MFNRLYKLKLHWLFLIYIITDVFCAGAGMGVPIFCILLGFLTGYVIIRVILLRTDDYREILIKSFMYGIATVLITFLLMLIIWSWAFIEFSSRGIDYKNFGQPLILFDPKASFYAWFVLMILISPLLQLLTTVFSIYITLMKRKPIS